MTGRPEQLSLEVFRKKLHGFFEEHGRVPDDPRIRDSVVEALGPQIESLALPIPGVVSDAESTAVARYYQEEGDPEEFVDAAHKAAELGLDCFRLYQQESGQDAYIIWSDAFYDDPQGEEEKVFRCPIDYSVPRFVEGHYVSGLLVADTVLLRPDFTQLMVLFHHGRYELYDLEFARSFRRFCRDRRA